MPGLREVDANLVRATGLEADANERRGAELTYGGHVRDGVLAFAWPPRRAPNAVAAIGDERRFDAPARHGAVGDGEVLAPRLVALEDLVQRALGEARLREAEQAGRVFV